MTLVEPNLLGMVLGLTWWRCSRAMCRLTVLLRVKLRWQKGQGTRIPWCRCRMCARKLVSYPYVLSQKGHFSFVPETNII